MHIRSDSELAALLLAIDPGGLKGAIVLGASVQDCERWLASLTALYPAAAPIRRIPAGVSEERLIGGLDFAATLASGKTVAERGILAGASGGVVVLASGTTRASTWSHVARALDAGEIVVERDGLTDRQEARVAAIVMQTLDDDPPPASMTDRVALVVDASAHGAPDFAAERAAIAPARALLPTVTMTDAMLSAIAEGASALGIVSPRVTLAAIQAARASAALSGRVSVVEDDLAVAARLVLAPRGALPDEESPAEQSPGVEQQSEDGRAERAETGESGADGDAGTVNEVSDVVVRAVRAAIPSGLIAASAAKAAQKGGAAGKAGGEKVGTRGRQVGSRRGRPGGGARLDLVATLRAAAPMQRIRRTTSNGNRELRLVELRKDDFRIRRCVSPLQTTTIFVVDASGSSALHRLAELKGAVEMMLAEGYARRERVAVISFRGTSASLVLPPTHALARARRAIAGMPAGGGTPLASALDLCAQVILAARRDAGQVVAVLLTDGRANVARDGTGGRERAQAEALDSARRLALLGVDVVCVDTAPRASANARDLAMALRARYIALPSASSASVRDAALGARHDLAGVHAHG